MLSWCSKSRHCIVAVVWVVSEIDTVTENVYPVSVVSGKHSQLLGDIVSAVQCSSCSHCTHVISVLECGK